MRYNKVLLVNPPSCGEWKGIRPHIGQGYIAETLAQEGIEYDVLDMNLGYKFRHLQRKIETLGLSEYVTFIPVSNVWINRVPPLVDSQTLGQLCHRLIHKCSYNTAMKDSLPSLMFSVGKRPHLARLAVLGLMSLAPLLIEAPLPLPVRVGLLPGG